MWFSNEWPLFIYKYQHFRLRLSNLEFSCYRLFQKIVFCFQIYCNSFSPIALISFKRSTSRVVLVQLISLKRSTTRAVVVQLISFKRSTMKVVLCKFDCDRQKFERRKIRALRRKPIHEKIGEQSCLQSSFAHPLICLSARHTASMYNFNELDLDLVMLLPFRLRLSVSGWRARPPPSPSSRPWSRSSGPTWRCSRCRSTRSTRSTSQVRRLICF